MSTNKNTIARPAAKQSIMHLATIGNLVIIHWALYWIMNGFDKFLNRTELGLFTWHGKDRSEQFGTYLSNVDLPIEVLTPLLYATGVIELLVAIPLLLTLAAIIKGTGVPRQRFELGFFFSAAIFSGFSFFDVIIGDRAELWEHGTFLIGLLLCYFLARNELENTNSFV